MLIAKCNFPWLLSNVKMVDGTPIANSKDYEIIEHNGIKIGLIGLAEFDWIVTLSHYEVDELSFEDPAKKGDELAIMLRNIQLHQVIHINATTSSR